MLTQGGDYGVPPHGANDGHPKQAKGLGDRDSNWIPARDDQSKGIPIKSKSKP